MDDLGFVRNESARQLRSGSSTVIALSLLDTWNPYFNEVARGVEDFSYPDGWSLSVSTSALDRARERRNFELFAQRRVAGILAVPTEDASIEQLERLRDRGLSCALVDHGAGGHAVPSVSVDDTAGGRLAGEHLRDLGRSRILFAGNPDAHAHAADRMRGLVEGAGPAAAVDLFDTGSVTMSAGRRVGDYVAAMTPGARPEAIFCANDLVAIGLLQSLIRARIGVPDEIAVVGYDDIEFASELAVPLTTVRQPAHELGRQAAELLIDDIRSGASAEVRHVVHTPTLVVRDSTRVTLGRTIS